MSDNLATVQQKVIAIIRKELKLDHDPVLTDLMSDFDADSLDRAEIIFSLEDEFGISLQVPNKETARQIFVSVGGVCEWVQEQLRRQQG